MVGQDRGGGKESDETFKVPLCVVLPLESIQGRQRLSALENGTRAFCDFALIVRKTLAS